MTRDGLTIQICTIYKRCLLEVQGVVFSADLMELPLGEFDLILGMDWSVEHQVSLDCASKRVILKMAEGSEIVMVGERQNYLSNVISAMVAEKLVQKGCKAYLAYELDVSASSATVDSIQIVREFLDVFPEELLGLRLDCEVEFRLELLPGTASVSIAPYRIAPKKFQELKVQVEEILDRGFIRPSVSPWGVSVLFFKKKDGSLRLCIDHQ
ncbi:DNA/RNA polymerases superfamily protein [Gossypium australe]|uniref:DNA/RNA polymerases superfamily protein n=1 Tax=Gossypium australe TaxID=47621 RepID=A0A5B6WZ62_9ROSI|nr:DNA/RNA polymerases superfamily protein [Gossypium australe]